ncbi:hypothetical protein ES702_04910 [subsurface metagenome]
MTLQTPKGKAEQVFTIEENGKEIKVMNWHGYYVQVGPHKSPFFFNEIEARRTQNKSNIIIITGSPGDGKTYTGIRLCEIFDPKFDPNIQIVFSRPELLHIIGEKSPLKRGQVVLIDEAHYGLGSRRWMENVQKDLMDALASVRSRGFIIIIVCLHIEMLDIIIRKYVLTYMLHMEERGVSVVYRLYTPRFAKELYKERKGKMTLQLPNAELCAYPDCLECEFKDTCMTTRAIYERRKKAFVDEASRQAEERAHEQEKKRRTVSDKDIIKTLFEYENEVSFTNKGNVEAVSIQLIIEREYDQTIGRSKLRLLGKRFMLEKMKRTPKTA